MKRMVFSTIVSTAHEAATKVEMNSAERVMFVTEMLTLWRENLLEDAEDIITHADLWLIRKVLRDGMA